MLFNGDYPSAAFIRSNSSNTAVTALGEGLACLKAPCSRLPMMSLPTTAPCHSEISHARHGISCLTRVLGRRRVLGIRSLAQDSAVVAEVVEEAQDIPLVQAEEEVEERPPASGVSEEKESEEQLGEFKRFMRKNQM